MRRLRQPSIKIGWRLLRSWLPDWSWWVYATIPLSSCLSFTGW